MPPVLKELAELALIVLARSGERSPTVISGEAGWKFSTAMPGGRKFEIRCFGADLPSTVPDEIVLPSEVPKNPQWQGAYRLVVAPPLVTLDLSWQPDSPVRIFTFSRGDWEKDLEDLAKGRASS